MNDKTIDQLRKEANEVKSCFTTFSFQGIAVSGLILAAITRYQVEDATVGLAGILVMLIVQTVSQIGNYKYGTANRHFGYQLYCEMLKTRNEPVPAVGWEEAIQAWRVVQPKLFDAIYFSKTNAPRFKRWWYRWRYDSIKLKDANKSYHWFDLSHRVAGKATKKNADSVTWYAGSYLRTVQGVLHSIAIASVIPVIFMVLQLHYNSKYLVRTNPEVIHGLHLFALMAVVVLLITVTGLILKMREIRPSLK